MLLYLKIDFLLTKASKDNRFFRSINVCISKFLFLFSMNEVQIYVVRFSNSKNDGGNFKIALPMFYA